MSVICRTQRKDLIGATVIDVDGRDVEGDLFDFKCITLELCNHEVVIIDAEAAFEQDGVVFSEVYLDVKLVGRILK